jgi:hypothetical protein
MNEASIIARKRGVLSHMGRSQQTQSMGIMDSESTTTGITPAFTEIVKVPVDTLKDPHILQLGTIESCSMIKYGADVDVEIDDIKTKTHVDITWFLDSYRPYSFQTQSWNV